MTGAGPAAQAPALAPLSWFGIIRLGLVQTALGAIFVLATSTMNRVMVIELALPAALPGLLVALHYAMQVLRPRLGHESDVGGRRTPWIIGGMAVLALGGVGAAVSTALMGRSLIGGIALAIPSFLLIGLGVGASGTALLVLLAKRTAPERRPAAATIAWVMMIAGFIITAATAGHFLDPFSPARLIAVSAAISGLAFVVSCLAVWGIEGTIETAPASGESQNFAAALREVWAEPQARRFAIFVFVSMLAYGGEDLLIEPFAGATFGLTPGATAELAGFLHGGALAGMIVVAVAGTLLRRLRFGALGLWMTCGCLASGAALLGIAGLGLAGAPKPLSALLFCLGAANGAYAIGAIGSMMQLVGTGGPAREGVRMGLWGAAQAIAFGGGGLIATVLSDVARHIMATGAAAYAVVFLCQALVFVYASTLAAGLERSAARLLRDDTDFAVPAADRR
ncbi:BCD family MFS transporter [Beijerinckia sp. L45]|uniref:BCD family MFS transporter n=1 Tax=Beijerinckia sp. L45 TaxID=1641855 RepID=UPI001FED384F|nr:BCD family MFS transporter [Beijerinckia sp. L45]